MSSQFSNDAHPPRDIGPCVPHKHQALQSMHAGPGMQSNRAGSRNGLRAICRDVRALSLLKLPATLPVLIGAHCEPADHCRQTSVATRAFLGGFRDKTPDAGQHLLCIVQGASAAFQITWVPFML